MKPQVVIVNGKKHILLEDGVTLQSYKEAIIASVLQENDNRVVESAKKLDIGKNTIYRIKEKRDILKG